MASLNKVSLEKGRAVSLDKTDGKITINLRWSQGGDGEVVEAEAPAKRGWLSAIAGAVSDILSGDSGGDEPGDIDLDLGCLFELADGTKGCVQALGEAWGDFNKAPYLNLSGDDRTGESTDGEFIYVNGAKWSQVRRVLVYSFIYDGVANWDEADGVVTLTAPGQAPLEVKLDGHGSQKTMCAIAMLENDAGKVKVTKLVEYFSGHSEMDRHYSWGLRWVAGSKD